MAAMVLGNYVIKDMREILLTLWRIGPILLPMSAAGFWNFVFSIIGTLLVNKLMMKRTTKGIKYRKCFLIALTAVACYFYQYMLPETMKMNFFGEGLQDIFYACFLRASLIGLLLVDLFLQ
jgi:K(+)-stimulated pyrophosphate-energized sodium pump